MRKCSFRDVSVPRLGATVSRPETCPGQFLSQNSLDRYSLGKHRRDVSTPRLRFWQWSRDRGAPLNMTSALAQSHPLKPVAGLTSLENRAGPGLSKKSVAKRKDFTHGSTGALACASRQTPPGGAGATWFAACLRGRAWREDSPPRVTGVLLAHSSSV